MRESPARIFLAPACGEKDCDNERTWCVDPVNGCDGCDAPPIAYVRADIAAAREARMREALETVIAAHDSYLATISDDVAAGHMRSDPLGCAIEAARAALEDGR